MFYFVLTPSAQRLERKFVELIAMFQSVGASLIT